MFKIVLASASPRRKELLQQVDISVICLPVDIDERVKNDEKPLGYCQRLALEKAKTGWQKSDKVFPVLGSDTIVVFDNHILGKPKDNSDAFKMLMKLSGKEHQVITAIAMVFKNKQKVLQSISSVQFSELNQVDVLEYIKSGQPMDKAGGYGIQGFAATWVKHISGSYSGIMGLPLYETMQLINEFSQHNE